MIFLLPKRTASHNKMPYLTIRKSKEYLKYSDVQKVRVQGEGRDEMSWKYNKDLKHLKCKLIPAPSSFNKNSTVRDRPKWLFLINFLDYSLYIPCLTWDLVLIHSKQIILCSETFSGFQTISHSTYKICWEYFEYCCENWKIKW